MFILSALRNGRSPISSDMSVKIVTALNSWIGEELYSPDYFITEQDFNFSLAVNQLEQVRFDSNTNGNKLAPSFAMGLASGRLKQAMFELNVGGKELAEEMGISFHYLSDFRRGQKAIPLRMSRKIATVLNRRVGAIRYPLDYFVSESHLQKESSPSFSRTEEIELDYSRDYFVRVSSFIEARLESSLSRDDVAYFLEEEGITARMIEELESGRASISLDKLEKIVELFNEISYQFQTRIEDLVLP